VVHVLSNPGMAGSNICPRCDVISLEGLWQSGPLCVFQSHIVPSGAFQVPVPTAWRVLGLRMEERPPAMEVSCEYIE
jgi:hypothetical protein